MKQWRLILGVTASVVLVTFLSTMVLGAGTGAVKVRQPKSVEKKADIMDTIAKMESLKTLASAIKKADMAEDLKGKGPFTILAPNDAAWKKIPADRLAKLLNAETDAGKERLATRVGAQVFAGKLTLADLKKADLEDAGGKSLKVTTTEDGKLKIGRATVIKGDIECSNGIIHVVDAVFAPGP